MLMGWEGEVGPAVLLLLATKGSGEDDECGVGGALQAPPGELAVAVL
jgi:hypothetical protein